MKRRRMLVLLPLLGAMMFWMAGCEMPWDSDDDDDPIGNSTIQGSVNDFDSTATASAKAGNREGVVVYLEGPADKSTTTGADGIFIFSGLPAGTYTLRFKYNGEEVTYRGNSGQAAQITLAENQRIELNGVSISGGTVNIGNIRYIDLDPVSTSSNDDEEEEATTTEESTPAAAPSNGTVTMTVNVKRKV